MPLYEFEAADGNRRLYKAPASEISEVTERLLRIGWRRVWNAPNVIVQLSYAEAMEEGERWDAADADRYRKVADKRWREVIGSFRSEDWDEAREGLTG